MMNLKIFWREIPRYARDFAYGLPLSLTPAKRLKLFPNGVPQ